MSEFVGFIDMGDGFGEVEAWNGTTTFPPDGTYTWEVVGGTVENRQLVLTHRIVEGSHKGFETRSWNGVDSDIGRKRLRALLNACGVAVHERGFEMNDLLGKQYTAEGYRESYKSKQLDDKGNAIEKMSFRIKGERPVGTTSARANGSVKTEAGVPTRGRSVV